tara:strand:- start:3310 stop:4980 length:1671 start_codon:yes stop_codon:yes gene_type:complete
MMQQQMSLFQEGGLEQDGGTVDPVSGNDVPVGSSQEEVRDDIPAQLSEGEFVFPADVVRFIGLEKLMMMRQEAKAGLKRMEEMGQMGNSEEATIPDDLPFTIDDLDMEDDPQEMAQGGVMAANGVFTQPSNFKRIPEIGINPPPSENAQQPIVDEQATFYDAPTQTTEQQPVASFEDLFGGDVSYGYDELRKYVGPNGEIEYIAFKGGEPLPAYTQKLKELTDKGFTYEDPTKVEEDPTDVKVDTAQVTQKEDKEGDATSFKNMQQRENDIQESYRNAIQRVMDSQKISAEEAVQFIKDGNYTVMGKKVPGFLFPDIKLFNQTRDQKGKDGILFNLEIAAQQIEDGTFTTTSDGALTTTSDGTLQSTSTNENLTSVSKGVPLGPNRPQPMSVLNYPEPSQADTDTMIGATKPVVKQIVPEEDKPEPVVSDMPMGSKPLDVSDKEIDEIINYKGESGNPYLDQFTDSKKGITTPFDKVVAKNIQDPSDIGKEQQIIKAVEDRQAEREQNQAKVKEETKKETFQQKINRRGGFKAGGIASKKPKKKKVMKRGGLASKK